MKRLILFLVLSMGILIEALAQSDAIYIYKKDGTIQSFLKEEIDSISYSHYDTNNVYYDAIVSQEIKTKDGISRIFLEDIDSVMLIAPKPEISINSAYVSIDWDSVSLKDCDWENYIFHLQCNGEIPDVKPSSIIVINENDIMHIVLVTKVEKNGNEITIKGYPGGLENLFFDTEFVIEIQGPNISKKSMRASKEVGDNYFKIEKEIKWNFSGKIDFIEEGSTKDKASYIDYNANLYIAPKLKFRFGDAVETIMDGVKFLSAKYFDVDACITGSTKWNCDYVGEVNSKDINIDLAPDQEDKYELLPIKIPERWVVISIASIPIPIAIGGDFYKQVTLNIKNTHGKVILGFDVVGEGIIGFRYNGITDEGRDWYGDWHFIPNRHDSTLEGCMEAEAKFYIFPRIHAWILGKTGPSIDIKPYFRANLSGGCDMDIVEVQKNNYLAWSLEYAAGVDWALGLSSSAWGTYEGCNKELFNGTFTDNDWILCSSPNDIKFLSSSSDEIKKNNPIDVIFEVCDTSFLGKMPTLFSQVVKFECNTGTVEGDVSCYSFANDGKAIVKWTPGSSSDVLYARMYDKDGNIIAEDSYGDSVPVAITGDSINITSNSAEVNCSFLRVPESSVCGVDYWAQGNDANVDTKTLTFIGDSITQKFVLEDLSQNTEYLYCAFIKKGDKYYYGEEKNFRTQVFLSLCPDNNHPHAIDLGLPSGTKWCCCNVGASAPEEFGGYYAWGETNEKSEYNLDSYTFYDHKHHAYIDIGSNISCTQYDVAYVRMGTPWRMPTRVQQMELVNNCTRQWIQQNGVSGTLVTGPNGGMVFLPAAGCRWDENFNFVDSDCYYWSGSRDSKYSFNAYNLYSKSGYWLWDSKGYRYWGEPVRPVCP